MGVVEIRTRTVPLNTLEVVRNNIVYRPISALLLTMLLLLPEAMETLVFFPEGLVMVAVMREWVVLLIQIR